MPPTQTVAIVGRPNVGKSTLYNRLVGGRAALVDDRPGVTRDWQQGEARLGPLTFTAIDTAGLDDSRGDSLQARMVEQSQIAITRADLVLFLIDGRAGVTPLDSALAAQVRRGSLPVILVVNKVEGRAIESGAVEAYDLGLGEPVLISAEHGDGMSDLYDAIAEILSESTEPAVADADHRDDGAGPLRLTVVGRPNTGKSTLINRLLGDQRVLTGPEPGVTRDAIAIAWHFNDRPMELIDTAGLRRKSRVTERVERLSTQDALRAVRATHVALLIVDATAAIERQDLTIAARVIEEGRALVIGLNKWDKVQDPVFARKEAAEVLRRSLPQARGVSVVALSARTGDGVTDLIEAAFEAHGIWNMRVPTARLNQWLADILAYHPPPIIKGRRIKMRYITQTGARPPTFKIFVNKAKDIPDSYRRYLVNGLREDFGMPGTPIRLLFRSGDNPYAPKK